MDNSQGIFSQLAMAVAGGIVTILLVAIWNRIASWVWVQLQRVRPFLRQVSIGVLGTAVVFVAIALWTQMEATNHIQMQISRIDKQIEKNTSNIVDLNDSSLKVLTGRILITTNNEDTFAEPYKGDMFGTAHVIPDLTSVEKANRGVMSGRIDFPEPFTSAPQVNIALSTIDTDGDTNTRIRTTVDQVDAAGFNYRFHVWHDSVLYRAEVSWIAIGKQTVRPDLPTEP